MFGQEVLRIRIEAAAIDISVNTDASWHLHGRSKASQLIVIVLTDVDKGLSGLRSPGIFGRAGCWKTQPQRKLHSSCQNLRQAHFKEE